MLPYLPKDPCQKAAQAIFARSGTAIIATGFYIPHASLPETDGPPGALAIGRALEQIGYTVAYVTDHYSADLLEHFAPSNGEVIRFPISGVEESKAFARQLIDRYQPALLVSVERCGLTRRGKYTSYRGLDLSPYTARIDTLFETDCLSVAIGDGGNEIGMGNLIEQIESLGGIIPEPSITQANHLIIASVSNWGGYGLAAALSAISRLDLLPEPAQEARLITEMVTYGACDGTLGLQVAGVDGFSVEENCQILALLHEWVTRQI
ncbi:MAG: DUF4392 domain-containing protein [Chloroflexi bacterium]|nr:DUF4392 domain-containing protein [Chloroflexota bacterium]